MKGLLRDAKVLYPEKPGAATEEGAVSVAAENPGLKGSWSKA